MIWQSISVSAKGEFIYILKLQMAGQIFVCNGWERPEGFCESAWETVSPFVMTLAHGGENFYDGWMKNPKSAMISCNDGFRPVSFLIETMDEDSESTI